MLNCAIIMGRLTAAPELKTTPNGVSVTSFRVAVDRKFVRQGEERQADFIDVVAWRQTAEFVCRHFRKGSMIAVQGSLQSLVPTSSRLSAPVCCTTSARRSTTSWTVPTSNLA